MTRGTLTTFSIANDVAFCHHNPAIFIASIPSLQALNIMHLDSPESAILSAVILTRSSSVADPLRGDVQADRGFGLLRRNLFIYRLGGVIVRSWASN